MARIPRLLLQGESATYHVISRSHEVSDDEVRERYRLYRGRDAAPDLLDGQIPLFRQKWASLSELVKDLKQSFSRWFNRTHARTGFFWGERFKSVFVEDGDTLVNCLAYLDLNPVRAGIASRPEDYRWCSLAYHVQTANEGEFLSLDLGLRHFGKKSDAERLRAYRRLVYEVGSVPTGKGRPIAEATLDKEERRNFELSRADRLLYRTRYCTESGVIGTKAFVAGCYRRFEDHFACRHEKKPHPVTGLDGVFSLKRLRRAT